MRPARKQSPLLGILVSAGLAGVVWTVLAAAPSGGLLASKEPQLPGNGVIGLESRVPLPQFVPDEADRFPGWENVGAAVVRVSCEGGTGSGVLIGEGDRMLSAAHVFLNEGGQLRVGREVCTAIHPGGDRVPVLVQTLKGGEFAVPGPLESHFSFPVTMEDWVVLRLARPVRGGRPLPVASREEILLTDGQPVINIAGPQDNLAGDGFFGQVCQYRGVPPATSDVDATGGLSGVWRRMATNGRLPAMIVTPGAGPRARRSWDGSMGSPIFGASSPIACAGVKGARILGAPIVIRPVHW